MPSAHILLVDDAALMRRSLAFNLEQAGYRVSTAARAEDALAMAHKITIIPHGRALGVTAQMPSDDHYNYSREYLLARLAVMLGGRAAEEIALDDITTTKRD